MGGVSNTASGPISVVSGGSVNSAEGFASAVAGGINNTASGSDSLVAGANNTASGDESFAVGSGNTAGNTWSIVMGVTSKSTGQAAIAVGNNDTASGDYSVAMGGGCTASGPYSTAFGNGSQASGHFAVALGNGARATNDASFVWTDGSATTTSTNASSVTLRASGGYRLYTGSSSVGVFLASGSTAWATISDQNAKKNFAAVDGKEVLDKLAAMPVEKWNYKWEQDGDVPHIGPMAQAFKTAFYPGRDDTSITTLEFDGVELAAIQGLNQKVEEKDAVIQEQTTAINELKARLDKLERVISTKLGEEK